MGGRRSSRGTASANGAAAACCASPLTSCGTRRRRGGGSAKRGCKKCGAACAAAAPTRCASGRAGGSGCAWEATRCPGSGPSPPAALGRTLRRCAAALTCLPGCAWLCPQSSLPVFCVLQPPKIPLEVMYLFPEPACSFNPVIVRGRLRGRGGPNGAGGQEGGCLLEAQGRRVSDLPVAAGLLQLGTR